MGEGGIKNVQKIPMYFMDGPWSSLKGTWLARVSGQTAFVGDDTRNEYCQE